MLHGWHQDSALSSCSPGTSLSLVQNLTAGALVSQSQSVLAPKPDGGAQLRTQMCLAATTQKLLLGLFAALSDFDILGLPGVAPPATRGLWFF